MPTGGVAGSGPSPRAIVCRSRMHRGGSLGVLRDRSDVRVSSRRGGTRAGRRRGGLGRAARRRACSRAPARPGGPRPVSMVAGAGPTSDRTCDCVCSNPSWGRLRWPADTRRRGVEDDGQRHSRIGHGRRRGFALRRRVLHGSLVGPEMVEAGRLSQQCTHARRGAGRARAEHGVGRDRDASGVRRVTVSGDHRVGELLGCATCRTYASRRARSKWDG